MALVLRRLLSSQQGAKALAPFAHTQCRFESSWRKKKYNKDTHPREWAIWGKLDTDKSGTISTAEIRQMCRKFDATSHADLLEDVLDPLNYGYTNFEQFVKNFNAVAVVRRGARLKHWHRTFGLGVAGNVAGHMAQAGEADEPAGGAALSTPAAVFTFYAPHPHTIDATEDEVLDLYKTFPVTNAVIDFPKFGADVQVEPEVGLYVDIVYSRDGGSVERLVPRRIAAFNDCSIRSLEGAQKLRDKKNWGFGSKGISLRSFRINSFSKGSLVDNFVLASYIKREDQIYKYSVDAPARNYLMFNDPLLEWIIDRINNQKEGGKWEEMFPQFVTSDYPTSMWIALGAGEYTEWGAKNFLRPKDESLVMIYDETKYPSGPDAALVESFFLDFAAPDGIIHLHQTIV
eukprot:TRINITY_DN36897_c0_g1_i1.p1 TRINITY_DN36897_c0_g1~~TRINITY_DN36897_c0_g1_i1.p1  ORF type:complete len:402 (-),score=58.69 TRINITY_DN36897_c0_g1_i1:272-1477(-)